MWRVRTDEDGQLEIVDASAKGYAPVARVCPGDDELAHARLMCAAPHLLAALLQAREHIAVGILDEDIDVEGGGVFSDGAPRLFDAMDIAIAAARNTAPLRPRRGE